MTDPDRNAREPSRNDVSLWILAGLMGLIAVGGLVYGLSYSSIHASNPSQTVGSAASHARSGQPM
ncbi:MAG: hypothetical protein QOF09_989 [Alphaproteobacteria bacterium]|jgi:hypothetical protein|nr:hypothetical protein [Alphaproteobacteria bacterium]